MSAGTTIASILLLCALAAAGVWLRLTQQQTIQREAFQALAARRGWSLTIAEQKLGRPAILRLTARSGRGWHCESRLSAGPDYRRPEYLTTAFAAEDPRWAEGHLVLTARPLPPDDNTAATAGLPQGKSHLSLQDRVDLALPDALAGQLQSFPSAPGLNAQATSDPAHRFDLTALANVVADWPLQQTTVDGQPLILIGPDGFQLQVSHGMRRADQMEPFIDFALDIIRVL